MELLNYYYVPNLSQNITYHSCLYGHKFFSEDNGCSISKNDNFHASVPIVNGLFSLNLDDVHVLFMLNSFVLMI